MLSPTRPTTSLTCLSQAYGCSDRYNGDEIAQVSKKSAEGPTDIEREALEEIPLGHSNTHRCLASEIIEQHKTLTAAQQEKEYGILYLFRRMGAINKGEWKRYLFGSLFTIGPFTWSCKSDLDR